MGFTIIPPKADTTDPNAAIDINDLYKNTEYFYDAIRVVSDNVAIGIVIPRSLFAGVVTPKLQVESTSLKGISDVVNANDATNSGSLWLGKSRGAVIGSYTVLQNNDRGGLIVFAGADGTNLGQMATISAFIDGTPGAGDLPSRLVFATSSDGSVAPTNRIIINSLGATSTGGETTPDVVPGGIHIEMDGTVGDAIIIKDGTTEYFAVTNLGQVDLTNNSASNPLNFGADVSLYRSAADTLHTPDLFSADGGITATSSVELTTTGDEVTLFAHPINGFSVNMGSGIGSDKFVVGLTGNIFFRSLGTLSGKNDVQYDTTTFELGYVSSSIRYKENIREEIDTDWMHKIPVVMYDRKDGKRDNEIGIIAEELEKIKPEWCTYDEKGNVESFSRLDLVPVLINEIQKNTKEIEHLKSLLH